MNHTSAKKTFPKRQFGLELRCGQCGKQWTSKRKSNSCLYCESSVIQIIRDSRPVTRHSPDTRLSKLVAYLNGKSWRGERLAPEALARLRDYATSWVESGGDAYGWQHAHPGYWNSIVESLKYTTISLIPTGVGFLYRWDWQDIQAAEWAKFRRVDKLFADFLTESSDRLGVCKGCGVFFETNSKRTSYHSAGCGRRSTSKTAKSQGRHDQRHRELTLAIKHVTELAKSYSKAALQADGFWKDELKKRRKSNRKKEFFTMRWLNDATLSGVQERRDQNCSECMKLRKSLCRLAGLS